MSSPDEHEVSAPSAVSRSRRRKRILIGSIAAASIVAIGGMAAWAGGLFGPVAATQVASSLTKYDIQLSNGNGDFVDATREDPLMLESSGTSSDLMRNGMEWTVVVKNEGAATGELFFVLCDPSSSKVKYRVAPGKDIIYPDLFTQLRFNVTDELGNVVIDNVMLGADEDNEPNGDGTVRGDISRVLEAGGGQAEFTVRATFVNDEGDATRTKQAAYSTVSTDFGILIEGESY